MKLVRIVAALVAFVFALGALPEISVASPTQDSVSSHHAQARRGKRHRHKKRARRHRRKQASSSGSKSKSGGGGMEF